jgi:hypothetical protein
VRIPQTRISAKSRESQIGLKRQNLSTSRACRRRKRRIQTTPAREAGRNDKVESDIMTAAPAEQL